MKTETEVLADDLERLIEDYGLAAVLSQITRSEGLAEIMTQLAEFCVEQSESPALDDEAADGWDKAAAVIGKVASHL